MTAGTLRQLLILAILVPFVDHIVGLCQVTLFVPALGAHDGLDRVRLEPCAGLNRIVFTGTGERSSQRLNASV